ncbi:MAG: hypothetical protein SVY10_11915 [Thermodesulfobacteriota bacterium]|nr:hypothetical protein [Thermodesulfobacteriota bacterium]
MRKIFISIAIFSIFFLFDNNVKALTVDEIIKLKKAGVSDETIQMFIQMEQEKKREEKESSHSNSKKMGTWEVKNSDGKEVTIYTTGGEESRGEGSPEDKEEEKREKAWEMLKNILIDARNDEQ